VPAVSDRSRSLGFPFKANLSQSQATNLMTVGSSATPGLDELLLVCLCPHLTAHRQKSPPSPPGPATGAPSHLSSAQPHTLLGALPCLTFGRSPSARAKHRGEGAQSPRQWPARGQAACGRAGRRGRPRRGGEASGPPACPSTPDGGGAPRCLRSAGRCGEGRRGWGGFMEPARPSLPLFFFSACAGTAPVGPGTVPGVDGAPRRERPRPRAERPGRAGAGAPAFTAGGERGPGFRYSPPSTGRLTREVPTAELQCSERVGGRQAPADREPGRGKALAALPPQLPT